MTLAAGSQRTHALGLVRAQIAVGRATAAQIKKWQDELGADAVQEIVAEHAQPKPARTTRSATKSEKPAKQTPAPDAPEPE